MPADHLWHVHPLVSRGFLHYDVTVLQEMTGEYVTDYLSKLATGFVRDATAAGKPFFIQVR